MTKRKRTLERDDDPKPDWPEVLIAAGAAWLALRGIDPGAIGERAAGAAAKICALRERLEGLADEKVRRVMDCKAPAPCDCPYCQDKAREAARENAL